MDTIVSFFCRQRRSITDHCINNADTKKEARREENNRITFPYREARQRAAKPSFFLGLFESYSVGPVSPERRMILGWFRQAQYQTQFHSSFWAFLHHISPTAQQNKPSTSAPEQRHR